MSKKQMLDLLKNLKEDENIEHKKNERILIIDGLNLFFRNFATMNMVNTSGTHIGGLGGFLRSLGSLIRQINPTSVYIIFDGTGSSQNRKNIIPEYKSNRNITKITNWDIFQNVDEENDSKIDQISRLIQYLKVLPVKVISIPKIEADDTIAVLSNKLSLNPNNIVFMITNDRDYIQLIKKNVILYLPNKRDFYSIDDIIKEYGIIPENFIIYKTLLGDNSDKIRGAKGLGPKKILKFFPEISENILSLDDIFDICEKKLSNNVMYARILKDSELLRNSFKIMDLNNPMVSEKDIILIENIIKSSPNDYHPELFIKMYNEDQIGKIIRNVDKWLKDYFEPLLNIRIL